MEKIKILSPCGILGYGFPKESFMNGISEKPDAIVVDAGSTDAGPINWERELLLSVKKRQREIWS